MNTITVRDISRLTERQRQVLGEICFGMDDTPRHPRMLKALERMGMVVGRERVITGRCPPMRITEFEASLPAHIAYCEWCEVQGEKDVPLSGRLPTRMEYIEGQTRRCRLQKTTNGIGGAFIEEYEVAGLGRMRRITQGKEQWWEPALANHARDFIGPAKARQLIAEQGNERIARAETERKARP